MPRGTLGTAICALLLSVTASASNTEIVINSKNCNPQKESDAVLYYSDFHWNMSHQQMLESFAKTYKSEKRLALRAYLDRDSRIRLPIKDAKDGDAILPFHFVESVVRHIEAGLSEGVVEAVFFPDMGHSHYYIPLEKYETVYAKIDMANTRAAQEALFADPELQILYHTAEQLQFLDKEKKVIDDPHLKFRAHTRNLVGRNDGSREITLLQNPESAANTAGDRKGYYYWGSGFNLSANENGCFQYHHNGQTVNFDISLYDLESPPGEFIGDY